LFKRVMRKLDYALERTSHFLLIFCGILILLMGFAVTFGVTMRYAFHAPEPYTYEFSAMFLLFGGILAVAGVERLDRNVRNDLISNRYPQLIKVIVLNIIFPFLALIFVAVLTWKSVGNALYALQIGQISASPWAVPLAPIKFLIPFGYFLLCLVLIAKFVKGFILIKERKTSTRQNEHEVPGTL
jgi:TRAP-type mannitol/chloroaromatic compound transport system permease small subunit